MATWRGCWPATDHLIETLLAKPVLAKPILAGHGRVGPEQLGIRLEQGLQFLGSRHHQEKGAVGIAGIQFSHICRSRALGGQMGEFVLQTQGGGGFP